MWLLGVVAVSCVKICALRLAATNCLVGCGGIRVIGRTRMDCGDGDCRWMLLYCRRSGFV